jgi:ubiquinone/menaquinone biosynthesis C-methylase UbiE
VRAFRALGAMALGIDLNPGPSNPIVLEGDFHRLPFADAVFDLVYTNVLGHAFDLHALGREVCRVLKPAGDCASSPP